MVLCGCMAVEAEGKSMVAGFRCLFIQDDSQRVYERDCRLGK